MAYNILLIGGHGYIGKNLLDKLNKIKNEFNLNIRSIDLTSNGDFNDLKDEELKDVDLCIFFAAISGIQLCNEYPNDTINENILKPIYLFEKLRKHNSHIIFSSSIAARKPDSSLYAFSKRTIEKWLIDNINKNKRTILRFSNVFGGINFENKTSVIAKFRNAILNNEKLLINGDGKQERDFIHVDSICDFIISGIKKNFVYNTNDDIIELGSSKKYSILQVAELFKKYHNAEIKFKLDRIYRY